MSSAYLIKVGLDVLTESVSSSHVLYEQVPDYMPVTYKSLNKLIDAINDKDKVIVKTLTDNDFRSKQNKDNIVSLRSKLQSLSSDVSKNKMQINLMILALGMFGAFGVNILARKLARRFFNKGRMTPQEQSAKFVAALHKAGVSDGEIAEIIKSVKAY